MQQNSKLHLAILQVEESGIKVIEFEETSFEEISGFYQYHQALEAEYSRISKEYELLRNRYESSTIRNEQILTSLVGILTAYGIYDSQKHSVNLEPLIRPYFHKMMLEHEQQMNRQGFFRQRWEEYKLRNGIDTKTSLIRLGMAGIKFVANLLTKSSKPQKAL